MTRASAFVLAYHGCDKSVGEKILAGEDDLKPSQNDYDWLGTGIYFWENSPGRALEWAADAKQNPSLTQTPVKDPFVVGAIIDLGQCLDLLEAESINVVASGYKRLRESYEAAGALMLENKKIAGEWALRRLDCAVINFVHFTREQEGEPAYDTVRAPFVEGSPLYTNAGFHHRTHVQICIRKAEQILGYFRPRKL